MMVEYTEWAQEEKKPKPKGKKRKSSPYRFKAKLPEWFRTSSHISPEQQKLARFIIKSSKKASPKNNKDGYGPYWKVELNRFYWKLPNGNYEAAGLGDWEQPSFGKVVCHNILAGHITFKKLDEVIKANTK